MPHADFRSVSNFPDLPKLKFYLPYKAPAVNLPGYFKKRGVEMIIDKTEKNKKKAEFSQIGMDYLEPRLLPPMSCTFYAFTKVVGDGYYKPERGICLPDNGGPCIYGCGYIKNYKFWIGAGEPPMDYFDVFDGSGGYNELLDWAEILGNKYPQLRCIKLFGSYLRGTADENSDIDILIELSKDCNFKDISKKISFDIDLKRAGRPDIWFLRPDGLVIRYEKSILKKPIEHYPGFRHNRLVKNPQSKEEACCKHRWTKLYEEIQTARVLYQKKSF